MFLGCQIQAKPLIILHPRGPYIVQTPVYALRPWANLYTLCWNFLRSSTTFRVSTRVCYAVSTMVIA